MASSVPFSIEGIHQGWPNEPILYRIRVPVRGTGTGTAQQGPEIRYLAAPNPPKGASGIPDYRGELLAFDAVPAGDWNLGRLVDPAAGVEGKFNLTSMETADLESAAGLLNAGPAWADKKINLVDLLDVFYEHRNSHQANDDDNEDGDTRMPTDIQCMNHLSAILLPTPSSIASASLGPEVVAIWAWQPGHAHGIADEAATYATIQAGDPGLAPRFLAHITDNDARIIGFLLQRVAGAREAGPEDLDGCRRALARLHALGVAYGGRLRRHSFLVCGDGSDTVLLQRFGGSFETTDEEVFRRELESLERVLAQQPSELEQRNGPIDVELSEKLLEFQNQGLMHPFVRWQLENGGTVTLTADQHRELVADLAANDYRWTEEDMERARQRFGGQAKAVEVS